MRRIAILGAVVVAIAACGGSEGTDPTLLPEPTNAGTAPAPAPVTTLPADAGGDPPIELAGTSWNVTDYSQGPGFITNVWLTEVTISFGDDGTVSGSAGCNDFGGSWSASGGYEPFESGVPNEDYGQVLELTDLSWTEMACEDEDIMIQEGEILGLLQRAGRWVLIRDEFHLRASDGEFLFQAESA